MKAHCHYTMGKVRSYTLKKDSLDSDLPAALYSPIGGQYKTLTIPALVDDELPNYLSIPGLGV